MFICFIYVYVSLPVMAAEHYMILKVPFLLIPAKVCQGHTVCGTARVPRAASRPILVPFRTPSCGGRSQSATSPSAGRLPSSRPSSASWYLCPHVLMGRTVKVAVFASESCWGPGEWLRESRAGTGQGLKTPRSQLHRRGHRGSESLNETHGCQPSLVARNRLGLPAPQSCDGPFQPPTWL